MLQAGREPSPATLLGEGPKHQIQEERHGNREGFWHRRNPKAAWDEVPQARKKMSSKVRAFKTTHKHSIQINIKDLEKRMTFRFLGNDDTGLNG